MEAFMKAINESACVQETMSFKKLQLGSYKIHKMFTVQTTHGETIAVLLRVPQQEEDTLTRFYLPKRISVAILEMFKANPELKPNCLIYKGMTKGGAFSIAFE